MWMTMHLYIPIQVYVFFFTSGEFVYWAVKPIPVNPTFIVNTVHFQKPRIIYPHEAAAVEATGYALMVYLANNRMKEATNIMKWLQTMRNTIGGFGSTKVSIKSMVAICTISIRAALHIRML